jgi:hypothetical protein
MLTSYTLIIYLDAMLFLLGMFAFIAGILILALRTASPDIKTLAVQTTRLAQKGLAEDISGLVGNASNLLDSMNQMVRTTRGVGILLALLGMCLMGLACYFALQIFKVPL